MATMKAIGVRRHGPITTAEALVDIEKQKPGPPQGYDMLVRVDAIALNPIDWKMRKGSGRASSRVLDPPKVSFLN